MIQQIIGHFIAHKAAYLLTGAAMGVVATAVFAVKDSDKHSEAIEDFLYDAVDNTDIPEEDKEELIDGVIDPEEFYKEHKTKTERAIIFAKSYWRTGLCMAVTFGLMILSHVTMVKELAAVSAALGLVSTKYKDLQDYLKKNFPEQYEEVTRKLNRQNARRKISEKGSKKEESYDGRKRYYFPLSDQIVFMKPEDFVKVQAFMSANMGSSMQVTLNEVLDYIHYDLGYKDVHISDIDYVWEFPAGETVDADSFPKIEFEYDDVLDDESMVVCQVVRTNIDPEYRYAAEVKRA